MFLTNVLKNDCIVQLLVIKKGSFLGMLEKLQNTNISFFISVHPSIHLSTWNKSTRNGHIFITLFENVPRKFKFQKTVTRITATLHEELCAFMIVSYWIILRMWNVSDKNCRQNQYTHFMFSDVFLKLMLFIR